MNTYTFKTNTIQTALPQHVLDTILHIHTYYHSDLSLDYLAKNQHLNKCYLCQLFKESTHLTVTEFINKVRLEKSKDFLLHTSDSILDISLRTGFNNVTYYNRLFKKTYGMTPLQYRKNSLLSYTL